jgi:hypothetical protein
MAETVRDDAAVCAELVDALLSWSDEVCILLGGTMEARGCDMAGKSYFNCMKDWGQKQRLRLPLKIA